MVDPSYSVIFFKGVTLQFSKFSSSRGPILETSERGRENLAVPGREEGLVDGHRWEHMRRRETTCD